MGTRKTTCKQCGIRSEMTSHTCKPEHIALRAVQTAPKPAPAAPAPIIATAKKKRTPILCHSVKGRMKKPIGAFDIETVGMGGKYLGGYVGYDGEDSESYTYCTTMSEILDVLLDHPNTIMFAHNGAGYEFTYLLDEIHERRLSAECICQGVNRVIGYIIDLGKDAHGKKQVVELRDSCALMPMSLKKAAKAFAPAHAQKEEHNFGKSRVEKVYDEIKQRYLYRDENEDDRTYDWNPNDPKDLSYCRADVQATIEAVKGYQEALFEVFGCGIGWTASGTALGCWLTTIEKGTAYFRLAHEIEEYCREGYYGGFVYTAHAHRHEDVTSIDRNAAYAAAMREGVPGGKPLFVYDYAGKPGLYRCSIIADKESIPFPFLPNKTQSGTLCFPYGRFTSIITAPEIEFGREKGYIIHVLDGYEFPKLIYPFNEFIEKCETVEVNEPDKKDATKLQRNGLYGKFGTKFQMMTTRICHNEMEIIEHNTKAFETGGKQWTNLCSEDGKALPGVYQQENNNEQPCIQPHWAAYVTALERLWMFKTILAIGVEHVLYGDTDSVKAPTWAMEQAKERGLLDIGKAYGQCKVDESYSWFQCLGPKVYWGELTDGTAKKRAKGIPTRMLTNDIFIGATKNEFLPVAFTSLPSVGARMKNAGKPVAGYVTRMLTNLNNSKTRYVRNDGKIVACTVYNGEIVLDDYQKEREEAC